MTLLQDTRPEMERYSRQLLLAGMGLAGQERLHQATVLVAGIGAMGGTLLLYLAGAGVGHILLMDATPDAPFAAGHRLLQGFTQPGVPAVMAAAQSLTDLNPAIQILPIPSGLESLAIHIPRCTLVVDAACPADHTQRINALCHHHGVPVLSGHVQNQWLHLRHIARREGPASCLQCLTPPPLPDVTGTFQGQEELWMEMGAGLAGCLLAEEAMLSLAGMAGPARWDYLDHHLPSAVQRTGRAVGQAQCPVCAHQPAPSRTSSATAGQAGALVDDEIDITGETCPMTFVRVKLKLESMPPGARLRIRLQGMEPLENVPRTLRHEHYVVGEPVAGAGQIFTVDVLKPLVTG